jgi:hypothetical protein
MEQNNEKKLARKGKKNPLLAQASTQASETYVPPAPAPYETRRSGRTRSTTVRVLQSKKTFTGAEQKQMDWDEEVACKFEEEDKKGALPRTRGHTTGSNSSAANNEHRENLDRELAQALQREEALKAGFETRGPGDMAPSDIWS